MDLGLRAQTVSLRKLWGDVKKNTNAKATRVKIRQQTMSLQQCPYRKNHVKNHDFTCVVLCYHMSSYMLSH